MKRYLTLEKVLADTAPQGSEWVKTMLLNALEAEIINCEKEIAVNEDKAYAEGKLADLNYYLPKVKALK